MRLTERLVRILTGLITLVVMTGVTVVAVEYASGHFDNTYNISATFNAAGQGLIQKSDVKVRGFTIGEVAGVHLRDGRARVTMRIQGDQRVPTASTATIRPKTLFGEKFVDIDVGDERPPYLRGGGVIRKTVGGFELERVLTDAEPVLRALDPVDVATVFGTLAAGSEGEGETIGHQIAAQAKLAEVFARHADDTRRFLDDFDTLAAALERGAPDVVGAAQNLNDALPVLNAHGAELAPFLDGVADLSQYLAEVFEANRPTLVKAATTGGQVLNVLTEKRSRIAPLLNGLREFFQAVAEAGHYDGTAPLFADPQHVTHLAAVKFIVGGGSPSGGASSTQVAPLSGARRALLRGASAVTKMIARTLGAPEVVGR